MVALRYIPPYIVIIPNTVNLIHLTYHHLIFIHVFTWVPTPTATLQIITNALSTALTPPHVFSF